MRAGAVAEDRRGAREGAGKRSTRRAAGGDFERRSKGATMASAPQTNVKGSRATRKRTEVIVSTWKSAMAANAATSGPTRRRSGQARARPTIDSANHNSVLAR